MELTHDAIELLKRLIATPSISKDEKAAADIMEQTLCEYGFNAKRSGNNVWAQSHCFDGALPTVLLNAHIDTVKPVATWNKDPYQPTVEDGKLYGLGSNDCGGGLVALLQAFRYISEQKKQAKASGYIKTHNFIYLASCEEEISGQNGFSLVLPDLPEIELAIVGEPTGMQPAVAEKGLMVVDCTAHGRAGHAARNEGDNAIYHAIDDITWLRTFQFPRQTQLLGPVRMTTTIINAGTQHNVLPDRCDFTVDVRTNECYTNDEILATIRRHLTSDIKPRSTRLSSSRIDIAHPLVQRAVAMGRKPFGSPTLSDQALMPFPSMKMGPGHSERSHTADEFICFSELNDAVADYITLLDGLRLPKNN